MRSDPDQELFPGSGSLWKSEQDPKKLIPDSQHFNKQSQTTETRFRTRLTAKCSTPPWKFHCRSVPWSHWWRSPFRRTGTRHSSEPCPGWRAHASPSPPPGPAWPAPACSSGCPLGLWSYVRPKPCSLIDETKENFVTDSPRIGVNFHNGWFYCNPSLFSDKDINLPVFPTTSKRIKNYRILSIYVISTNKFLQSAFDLYRKRCM